MPSYDGALFKPPAPMASVTLRNPANAATISNVRLLLDTGADITLLPRRVVDTLAIPVLAGQNYELIGFDGSKSAAQAVSLEMQLLSHTFRGQYLLIDSAYGILGRDVLNHLALLLNGPRAEWSELKP